MWVLGAVLNVAGSVLLSGGMGSMKMGYAWQEALSALDEPGESPIPIYRVRQWQVGAALYLAGNMLQFLSFAFAAQSLLLALSSLQFGTHLLFAWLMEGVNVPFRSMLGAGIIIFFNLLLVVYGSKSSELMTAEELLELFREPQYIAYQVIGALACIAASAAYLGTATATSRLSKRFPFILRVRPVLLAVAASIPGTQALLHSKCLATMLVVTLGQANQMNHWFFWLAAAVQAAAAAIWTAALTHGMNMFPTVIVLPILQVVYTLVGIVCGTVFFREWRDMSSVALCMYAVGFVGMAVGIRVGISPDELAEGLEQLDGGDNADSDEDVSDGASVASSNSSGEQTRARRTTFAPRRTTLASRKSVRAALNTTRSSMHATALTSLGLGDNNKLRCASVFVSPMALGTASLSDAASNRRITMTQQAALQRRRTTLAKTENAQPSKSKLEALREDEEEGGSLGADWGGPTAVNSMQDARDGGRGSEDGDGHKRMKRADAKKKRQKGEGRAGEHRSKDANMEHAKHKGRSFLSRWGLLGGPWGRSGDSSDEEEMQRPGRNVVGDHLGGGKSSSGENKAKNADDEDFDGDERTTGHQEDDQRKRSKSRKKSKRKALGQGADPHWKQHAEQEEQYRTSIVQGEERNASDRSYELTTEQITLTMGGDSTGPRQCPISSPSPPPSPALLVSRADLAVRSVSQLDMVLRTSITEQGQPFTSPPSSAPVQAPTSHLESHSTQHQGAAGQYHLQANLIHPHQNWYYEQQQQQQSSANRGNPAMAGTVALQPQYVATSNHVPVLAAPPQLAIGSAPWPGYTVRAPSPDASSGHPVEQHHQHASMQQLYTLSSSQEASLQASLHASLQAYEPGALLRATSQMPLLSQELASHGLNSQAQGPPAAHVREPHDFDRGPVPTSAGSQGSSPWTSPSLSPAVTPAASRAPSAGHFQPGTQPPRGGAEGSMPYAEANDNSPTAASRHSGAPPGGSGTLQEPAPYGGDTGESSFAFSFNGGTGEHAHAEHREAPAHRAPSAIGRALQPHTKASEHSRPPASMTLAGWHPLPTHAQPPPPPYPDHSVPPTRQPTVAHERASMGMYRPQHRVQEAVYQFPGLGQQNQVAQHRHGFEGAHRAHTYNPLALDSTPSSFTSVQGDMKAMGQPEPARDTFIGFQAANTSRNSNFEAVAGTGMHAHVSSGGYTPIQTGTERFNQPQIPSMQQQQHTPRPVGTNSRPVAQQQTQQSSLQQPYWPNQFAPTLQVSDGGFPLQQQGHLWESQGGAYFTAPPPFATSEALASTPYGSQAQSRAGSPQPGQQAASLGLAADPASQRGSSVSQTSMTSFIAHDSVNDAPGLSWLYAQAPQ